MNRSERQVARQKAIAFLVAPENVRKWFSIADILHRVFGEWRTESDDDVYRELKRELDGAVVYGSQITSALQKIAGPPPRMQRYYSAADDMRMREHIRSVFGRDVVFSDDGTVRVRTSVARELATDALTLARLRRERTTLRNALGPSQFQALLAEEGNANAAS